MKPQIIVQFRTSPSSDQRFMEQYEPDDLELTEEEMKGINKIVNTLPPDVDVGTFGDLKWRQQVEEELGELLKTTGIGDCDGGQAGNGSMEIFFNVTDEAKGVEALKAILTDMEYIGFCKIVSPVYELIDGEERCVDYTVHYPENALFNIWRWIPNDVAEFTKADQELAQRLKDLKSDADQRFKKETNYGKKCFWSGQSAAFRTALEEMYIINEAK